jgi:predicted enzyme related to lactoylglutathione lyase
VSRQLFEAQVVHLELHTSDREASSRFYSDLLQWQTERIDTEWGSYHALNLGSGLDGGIVECGTRAVLSTRASGEIALWQPKPQPRTVA